MNNDKDFPKITHLLCGVDGSEPACRAAALAAQLAQALGAKLTYLTVASEAEPQGQLKDYIEAEGLTGQSMPLLSAEADSCLDQAINIARGAGAPQVERLIKTGDAASVICDTAGQIGADCIALGRHGRGAVHRLVAGSVSDTLAKNCDMTLVLVN